MNVNAICEASILKTAIKALKTLVSEARFHFNDGNDGLHARAVDYSNVAMVIVDIPSDSFEVIKADGEVVGVDINRIDDITKSIKDRELLEIICREGKIEFKNKNITYTLSAIDPSAIRKEPKIPQLELPAKIVLDAGEFKKAIQMVEKISDQVVFRSDDSGFYIEAEGDVDKITFHMGDAELTEFNRAEARSMFGVEYLKEFTKIASSGDLLTIRLGTNYPVRLHFELEEGGVNVEYILAPHIETE
jgi:proliferating cell nuclear antigen